MSNHLLLFQLVWGPSQNILLLLHLGATGCYCFVMLIDIALVNIFYSISHNSISGHE